MRITAFLAGLGILAVPVFGQSSLEPREVAGAVFVLRGYDPAARTITLSGETGTQVLRVDDRTLLAVSQLSPGETLLVSYRYNRNAETEVIVRRIPTGYVTASQVSRLPVASSSPSTSRAVVLAADSDAGSLTVRDSKGYQQRFAVDASLLGSLSDLRPGDRVYVDVQAGRVVGLIRSR
jgi:hypothetical protein